MLRVELLVHGRDTAAGDWFVTASTEGATAGVVVRLAVRHAFVVEETAGAKHCVALLQDIHILRTGDIYTVENVTKPFLKFCPNMNCLLKHVLS